MHKYAVIIPWSDNLGDQVFVADVPELPGCTAHGDTHEEALASAQEAIVLWLETTKKFGDPLPRPGAISSIMRSENADWNKNGIEVPSPEVLRAAINALCRESILDKAAD